MDCFVPLTSFESLQEYALRHASKHGLKVTGSTETDFVLEPLRQRFFWKHQLKLYVEAIPDGYEREIRTRGRKYHDTQRVPSTFDDFFATYTELLRTPSQPVSIPKAALPY